MTCLYVISLSPQPPWSYLTGVGGEVRWGSGESCSSHTAVAPEDRCILRGSSDFPVSSACHHNLPDHTLLELEVRSGGGVESLAVVTLL